MTDSSVQRESAEVHVKSLVTGERAAFSMGLDSTLQQAWDEAYIKLDEARRDGDSLQCGGSAEGASLMDKLSMTLRQAREQRTCGDAAFQYEIKGPSGGAERK